jgi:hypothetical protein
MIHPPFENADKANGALMAFLNDVRAARTKHGIQQVLVGLAVEGVYDGQQGRAYAHDALGDQFNDEALAAWLLGKMAAERRRAIALLLEGKKAGNREPLAPTGEE